MSKNNLAGCLSTVFLGGVIFLGATIYATYTIRTAVYKINIALDKYINEPVIEQKDVIGSPKQDLFIKRNGEIFYRKIDGKSIEEILKE